MEAPNVRGRLGWFDAMRGLAIILVVLRHIVLCSCGIGDEDSVLRAVIVTFNMPLFFFISGFFAYRVCESWTFPRLGDFLKRKFQTLIICAVVFFGLYHLCRGEDAFAWVHNGFGGYWFTIVLFQAFVAFLSLSLLSKLFKSERILEVGLILISIVSIVVVAVPLRLDSKLWVVLGMGKFCLFFHFFAFGIFCRKYRELFETTLSKNWFKAGITICAVAFTVLYFHNGLEDFCRPLARFIHVLGSPYVLLLLVVAFFFTKREFFETQNGTSSTIRYIGQRTLDIYMIHWFLLPDLSVLKDWLLPGNMFILQLAIGLVVSALIIALCLLLSEILRLSKFLSAWLFGVKSQKHD